MAGPATLTVHPASSRYRTEGPAGTSLHAFSAGRHYDPDNTHHGPLLAHDEHHLVVGPGFSEHGHRDVEVVSVVLAGEVVHEDSTGGRTVLPAGAVGVLHAGGGVRHSEAARGGRATLLQMWLLPDEPGDEAAEQPTYRSVTPPAATELGWRTLVSGGGEDGGGVLTLACTGVALREGTVARAGEQLEVPDAARLHLTVLRGAVDLAGVGLLAAGDTVRGSWAGPRTVTAAAPAQLLVWTMPAPPVPTW